MAKSIAAGYTYTLYGLTDQNGGFIGSVAGGAVAGSATGSGMKRLRGGRTAPIRIPDTEKVVVDGDDVVLGTFQFKSTTPVAGVLETAVKDQTFIALAQSTLVESFAGGTFGTFDPATLNLRNTCWFMQRPAQSQDSATLGQPIWDGVMVGRSTVFALGSEFTQRTAAAYQYGIALNPFNFNPYGLSMTVATQGTTSGTLRDFETEYPLYMHCWLADNSRTTWTLPFEPIYQSDGTTPYGFEITWGNAVKTSGVDYTRSGATITISPALASGTYIRCTMQVDPANIETI